MVELRRRKGDAAQSERANLTISPKRSFRIMGVVCGLMMDKMTGDGLSNGTTRPRQRRGSDVPTGRGYRFDRRD